MFNNNLYNLSKSLKDKISKTNKYIFPSELVHTNNAYIYPIYPIYSI